VSYSWISRATVGRFLSEGWDFSLNRLRSSDLASVGFRVMVGEKRLIPGSFHGWRFEESSEDAATKSDSKELLHLACREQFDRRRISACRGMRMKEMSLKIRSEPAIQRRIPDACFNWSGTGSGRSGAMLDGRCGPQAANPTRQHRCNPHLTTSRVSQESTVFTVQDSLST
jgi:hypothetical protein